MRCVVVPSASSSGTTRPPLLKIAATSFWRTIVDSGRPCGLSSERDARYVGHEEVTRWRCFGGE